MRDHLGEHARRIYLVGALNFGPAKRRLLESHNIVPIDFSPLTNGLPQEEAAAKSCELFLNYLASRKPVRAIDWKPENSSAYDSLCSERRIPKEPIAAKALLEKLAIIWKSDRESCPDWLVMPRKIREQVFFDTRKAPWGYVTAIEYLDKPDRLSFLESITWRHVVTLHPLPKDIETLIAASVQDGNGADRKRRAELSRILLREARSRRDSESFSIYEEILESLAQPGSDARAELVAQKLLWARDELDLKTVSDGIKNLDGPDPAWRLLKASLHCECGELEQAQAILEALQADLSDRLYRAPHSISVMTRYAWTETFSNIVHIARSKTWDYKESSLPEKSSEGYDPRKEIELLHKKIRDSQLEQFKKPTRYEAQFAAGTYQDHNQTITFLSEEPGHEAETAFRFIDMAYMPTIMERVDFLGRLANDSLNNEPQPILLWHLRLLRVVWGYSDTALKTHFSRIAVAKLDEDVVTALIRHVLTVIEFWRGQIHNNGKYNYFKLQRLRVMLEVLSRIVIRADLQTVKKIFALGCELGNNSPHFMLAEQIGSLLKSSLESVPPDERDAFTLRCLEFPLPEASMTHQWPDPADDLFKLGTRFARPADDVRWTACVAKLLAAVAKNGITRVHAVNRLTGLAAYKCLTEDELQRFGRLLWSSVDPEKGNLPKDIYLFPHVVATLPGDGYNHPNDIVRSYLYSPLFDTQNFRNRLLQDRWYSIGIAALSHKFWPKILPARKQALHILDNISATLNNSNTSKDPLDFTERNQFFQTAGAAISYAILPVLEPKDLNESRLETVKMCAASGNGLAGIHELIRLCPSLEKDVVSTLRRTLCRGEIDKLWSAVNSISRWAELASQGDYPVVPDILRNAILLSLPLGLWPGLHPKLWCAHRLLIWKQMSDDQIKALADALCDLEGDLDYSNLPAQGTELVGITLAKAECVKLARRLADSGYDCGNWLRLAVEDALPEVRFALQEELDGTT